MTHFRNFLRILTKPGARSFLKGFSSGVVVVYCFYILFTISRLMFNGQKPRHPKGLLQQLNTGIFIGSHLETEEDNKTEDVIVANNVYQNLDDNELAEEVFKKVRILCWVMTYPAALERKTLHIKATWGKRCNKLLFFSSEENKDFPTIGLNIEEGRKHLTAKSMGAFRYLFKHHMNDADWFMKADDDTYVVVENLRYFLSSYDPNEPLHFGHRFKVVVEQGYHSGGAGYVLSKEALRRFGRLKYNECREDGGAEDLEMGKCMQQIGVPVGKTTDDVGRTRFHCFTLQTFVFGSFPAWVMQYDYYGLKKGVESVSDYAVSFHYVRPEAMYEMEYFIYHFRPHGILIRHKRF